MHFVHIIEINDSRHPLLEVLTREQLWRGLVRRAERPKDFLPQLNDCLIVMQGDSTLVRELDFGAFIVRDRVRLTPMSQISFDTEATATINASKLVIAIESQGGDHLQLRFTYNTQRKYPDNFEMEIQYDRYLQSAYLQADIDSVKLIRRFIAEGAL